MPWYKLSVVGRPTMDQEVRLERSYSEGDKIELDGETFDVLLIDDSIDQERYPVLQIRPKSTS